MSHKASYKPRRHPAWWERTHKTFVEVWSPSFAPKTIDGEGDEFYVRVDLANTPAEAITCADREQDEWDAWLVPMRLVPDRRDWWKEVGPGEAPEAYYWKISEPAAGDE